jgi:hypothetical protein
MYRNNKRVDNSMVLVNYMKTNGPWNKGKKGLQIAWNKGLTKELDHRVKKYAEIISKSRRGIKLSEEHKRILDWVLREDRRLIKEFLALMKLRKN